MKRREFIAGTTALLVSPRRSWAQGTRRRLGFLAEVMGAGRSSIKPSEHCLTGCEDTAG
jgi:putative ABC transport system substrate-binding protein